jgi:hypothetical protein
MAGPYIALYDSAIANGNVGVIGWDDVNFNFTPNNSSICNVKLCTSNGTGPSCLLSFNGTTLSSSV